MIHLLQIYKMIQEKQYFIDLFSDLEFELYDMGWIDDPTTLINDMLFNHFGITIECDRQLEMVTNCIINKKDLSFLGRL